MGAEGGQKWGQTSPPESARSGNCLKGLAPQAGFEPATLRLTGAAQGFLMESYRCSIFRTVNELDRILFFRPVTPIDPIFEGGWAQNWAQCFGRIINTWCAFFRPGGIERTRVPVDGVGNAVRPARFPRSLWARSVRPQLRQRPRAKKSVLPESIEFVRPRRLRAAARASKTDGRNRAISKEQDRTYVLT